jgi:hypothetical protein
MNVDLQLNAIAAANHSLITRGQVFDAGGSDRVVARRLDSRRWFEVHAGVYRIGPVQLDWEGRLRAATLAAGPLAMASHGAAVVLLGLDGIKTAPIDPNPAASSSTGPEGRSNRSS